VRPTPAQQSCAALENLGRTLFWVISIMGKSIGADENIQFPSSPIVPKFSRFYMPKNLGFFPPSQPFSSIAGSALGPASYSITG
jgi:hypothetical protein